jgi:hypothetical protein
LIFLKCAQREGFHLQLSYLSGCCFGDHALWLIGVKSPQGDGDDIGCMNEPRLHRKRMLLAVCALAVAAAGLLAIGWSLVWLVSLSD